MNVARALLVVLLAAGLPEREAIPSVQSSGSLSFGSVADVTLSENAPSTNLGGSSTTSADGDEPSGTGKELVTLLRWDLTAIPQGSVVLSATIDLHVTNSSMGEYEFYRMARGWKESEATWNQAETGTPWDGPGASGSLDRGFTVRGVVPADTPGPVTITLGAEAITAVQAWVDGPGVNYGFAVADGTNTDGLAFATREASVSSQRPKLTVTYMANSGSGTGGVVLTNGGPGFCGATGMEAVLVFCLIALFRALPPRK